MFLYVAVNLLAFAGFVLHRLRKREPVPNDKQTVFVPDPAGEMTEGSVVLNPRIEAPEPVELDENPS